jgi:pimeloyl-ACP methyl ester carboxylesterase
MTTIVLVPGAWLSAASWDAVAVRLEAVGHEVHPLTLPGLGERATRAAAQVRLADHVADVLDYLSANELSDVALVGHSYAGIVTGQVASCAPERVAHAVFLDSNLPRPGLSMAEGWSERGIGFVRARIEGNGGLWPRPESGDFAGQDLTERQIALLLTHSSDHPGRTIFDPAVLPRPLSEIRATYINCLKPDPAAHPDAEAFAVSPHWDIVDLGTGHWPMYSRPAELAALLDEVVRKGRPRPPLTL